MNKEQLMKIFSDTAYVRTGGSEEEKKTALYLQKTLADMGMDATLEAFEVDMASIKKATLTVDGKEIACLGYLCAGNGEVEAPLYYLRNTDDYSLSLCRGKIVLFDGYLGYWRYRDLLKHGALGFITYNGDVHFADREIDQRELRSYVSLGEKIPGVNINVKDAVSLIEADAKSAKITLEQDEYKGSSQNVVLEQKGEIDSFIVFTAHYDSTSLSHGAYDNMSGCAGLLALAEYFATRPHRYSLRYVFCGSEERGLLGSKAYCTAHESELENAVLNINLDMIGCVMGKFIACCSSEKTLTSYLSYMGKELGFGISAYQDVYSSDSTPFADKGVPAVSFARISPREAATIHNSYDTAKSMKAENLQMDIGFISAFAERMANAACCPVERTIPDNIKEKLDEYLCRKRKKG